MPDVRPLPAGEYSLPVLRQIELEDLVAASEVVIAGLVIQLASCKAGGNLPSAHNATVKSVRFRRDLPHFTLFPRHCDRYSPPRSWLGSQSFKAGQFVLVLSS